MNVIKYKWIFISIAAILTVASISAIAAFGFKQGIDFTGGSLWQIKIEGTTSAEVTGFFETSLSLPVSSISYDSASDIYSITLREMTDAERRVGLAVIKKKFLSSEEQDFWSISPSVSDEIRQKSYFAIAFVLVGISLYIAFAFRKVSRPISSWKYGLVTLITLMHNVAIPAGMMAVLSRYYGVAIDTNFVVALLVVMGFSVHDTIVVFDRIRENIVRSRHDIGFNEIINRSVRETMRRSINTSLTLILVLLALYFMGPVSLKYFILTMLVGTTVGIYSSIFVASPLLTLFDRRKGS